MAAALHASDVVLPPTFVIDFLYLGFPVGIAAGLAIAVAVGSVYVRTRRRGRGRAFSALMGALVLAGANLAIYLVWYAWLREPPGRRRFEVEAPAAAPGMQPGAEATGRPAPSR